MLKKRVGAALLIKNGWVVQSVGFKKYLPVGRPHIAVEFLNRWGIDEIFLVDISATKNGSSIATNLVAECAKYCRVPLAATGGIQSVSEMEELLHTGADKICLNHVLLRDRSMLTQGAKLFGEQCMVGVVDFIYNPTSNSYEVFDYVLNRSTGLNLYQYIRELEDAGAGEILMQSVDRDGNYTGFEIEAYKIACPTVKVPVVALGGAGNASHFIQLFTETDVSAACAGNIFHFTEHSVNMLKAQLIRDGEIVRLETYASYMNNRFDEQGRLRKADDSYLESLLFIRIEKEVI